MIKMALQEWHCNHASNLSGRVKTLQERVSKLDKKGESIVLSEDEVLELRGSTCDIHPLDHMNSCIFWQYSRLLWLQEGDANSKYFHSVLAGWRQGNAISSKI